MRILLNIAMIAAVMLTPHIRAVALTPLPSIRALKTNARLSLVSFLMYLM